MPECKQAAHFYTVCLSAALLLADITLAWAAVRADPKRSHAAESRLLDTLVRACKECLKAAAALMKALVAPKGKQQAPPGEHVLSMAAVVSHDLVAGLYDVLGKAQQSTEQTDPNAAGNGALAYQMLCLMSSPCILVRCAVSVVDVAWSCCTLLVQKQSNCADKKAKAAASKELARARRDISSVPELVFWIESYDAACLKLSKATKTTIVKSMKRTVNRDFRLKMPKALQEANVA